MIKKILAIVCVLVMIFTITACNKKDNEIPTEPIVDTTTDIAPVETETETDADVITDTDVVVETETDVDVIPDEEINSDTGAEVAVG